MNANHERSLDDQSKDAWNNSYRVTRSGLVPIYWTQRSKCNCMGI